MALVAKSSSALRQQPKAGLYNCRIPCCSHVLRCRLALPSKINSCRGSSSIPSNHSSQHSNGSNSFSTRAGAALLAGMLLLSGGLQPAAAVAGAGGAPLTVLEGSARIIDGDTLYIGAEKIRLYAVDAPEKQQACADSRGHPYPCGQVSLEKLKEHVASFPLRCEVKAKDQYGRNVAACKMLAGRLSEDLGIWMVSNGYAVAYRQYGKDYVVMEEKAHARHLGIWQGEFTEPALWRKQQKAASLAIAGSTGSTLRQPAGGTAAAAATGSSVGGSGSGGRGASSPAAAGVTFPMMQSFAAVSGLPGQAIQQQQPVSLVPSAAGPGVCSGALIKGNINSKGSKVYHTPLSGQYGRVEIDESKGERYFCSEEEALAAGWRPALK